MSDQTRAVVAALHRLSEEVEPSSTVLADTYRRAGRVRRRRRVVLAGVLVLALAAAGTVAQWYVTSRPGPIQAADYTASDLLTQPTRGNLTGDSTYRDQVIAAWRASAGTWPGSPDITPTTRRGEVSYVVDGPASVVLAQQTPAGAAAIVAQRARLVTPAPTPSGGHAPSGTPRQMIYVGYLDTGADGKPAVEAAMQYRLTDPLVGQAFLAGADRSWLVVLSAGDPLGLSTGRSYPPDAPPTRQFSPIRLHDGVAVVAVPPTADRTALAVAAPPADRYDDGVLVANTLPRTKVVRIPENDNRLQWNSQLWVLPNEQTAAAAWDVPNPIQRTHGETFAADKVVEAWRRAFNAEQADPFAGTSGESLWQAFGALPDGQAFVVGDGQLGNDPSYLYGAIVNHGTQTTIYGGRVDPSAVLPVKLRFPNGQGWLVAAKGATFHYRIGSGGWQPAGTNAALLPDDTTQVLVTLAGGSPTVVPLS